MSDYNYSKEQIATVANLKHLVIQIKGENHIENRTDKTKWMSLDEESCDALMHFLIEQKAQLIIKRKIDQLRNE